MISILVVDDSATARAALRQVIESDPQLMVVGEAESGDEALQAIERKRPNLVTMDVFLRRENGLDITESIMARCPTPILIVTGGNVSDPALVFRAMEVGALDVSSKLPSPRSPYYPAARDRFVRLIKTLSQVPVVHRKPRRIRTTDHQIHRSTAPSSAPRHANPGILVVGASTGGPPVLGAILGQLPRPFPLPIAVAQHMAEGFVRGFADWLADETTLPVVCVEEAVSLTPGTVYLPGEDCHLRLASRTRIIASTEQLDTHHRPSVDLLFDSAAQQFGGDSVAVLLTGMGRDGSSGLKTLHDADAFTIAQEPSSCAVDSMPRHAIEDGSACTVLVPGEIAPRITGYLKIDQV